MFNLHGVLNGAGLKGYIMRRGLILVTSDLMEAWECLEDFSAVRNLLEQSSNSTSWFWRFLWGSSQAKLVCRIKEDYKWEFEELLKSCGELFDSLNLGHQALFQEKVIKTLDFSTPGRAAAAVAFLSFIKDKWSEETHLSGGYLLDFLAMHLWRAVVRHKNRLLLLSSVRPAIIPTEEQQQQQEEARRRRQEQSPWNPRAGLDPRE